MDIIATLREIYTKLDNGHKEAIVQMVKEIEAIQANLESLKAENDQLKAQDDSGLVGASVEVWLTHRATGAECRFALTDRTDAAVQARLTRQLSNLADAGFISGTSPIKRQDSQPVPSPTNGAELSFKAGKLVGSVNEGQVYWKVKGGQFKKFGVTIWPEILEEAGFNPDELNPNQTYDLTGRMAYYILNDDGKPSKVVRLD